MNVPASVSYQVPSRSLTSPRTSIVGTFLPNAPSTIAIDAGPQSLSSHGLPSNWLRYGTASSRTAATPGLPAASAGTAAKNVERSRQRAASRGPIARPGYDNGRAQRQIGPTGYRG